MYKSIFFIHALVAKKVTGTIIGKIAAESDIIETRYVLKGRESRLIESPLRKKDRIGASPENEP
jgi:hypothetical protein